MSETNVPPAEAGFWEFPQAVQDHCQEQRGSELMRGTSRLEILPLGFSRRGPPHKVKTFQRQIRFCNGLSLARLLKSHPSLQKRPCLKMSELLNEAFSLHNLPVTFLLGAVLLYWLLVILGLADADDGGGVDASVDGGLDADAGHHGGEGGLLSSAGRFFHLGVIPFMIVLSVMSLFLWGISILSNYYLNGAPGARSHMVALGLLVPNLLVSALVTRLLLAPAKNYFTGLHDKAQAEAKILGRQGVVISAQVDAHYGQVEIRTQGAPLLLNARTSDEIPPIPKGALVTFIEAASDHAWYIVRPAANSNADD